MKVQLIIHLCPQCNLLYWQSQLCFGLKYLKCLCVQSICSFWNVGEFLFICLSVGMFFLFVCLLLGLFVFDYLIFGGFVCFCLFVVGFVFFVCLFVGGFVLFLVVCWWVYLLFYICFWWVFVFWLFVFGRFVCLLANLFVCLVLSAVYFSAKPQQACLLVEMTVQLFLSHP